MTGKSIVRVFPLSIQFVALFVSALSLAFVLFMPSGAQAQEPEPLVDPAAYSALVPLTNIKQISSGGSVTCALTTAGGVKCWGLDSEGQVGDGPESSNKTTPVDVVGLTSGVQAITTGFNHACALTTGGGVKCWGSDSHGQIGDGPDNSDPKSQPVDVVGLSSGVKAIGAGGFHTCALMTSGGLKCWGHDGMGQVGDGPENSNKPTPVDVVGLASGVQAVTGGQYSTCALTTSGGVKCWGYGERGQLGDGDTSVHSQSTPLDVAALSSGVLAISYGTYHVCAVITGGGVKCWGDGNSGQLGNGMLTNQGTPVDVIGLAGGIQAVTTGGDHSCALTTGGAIKCWGSDNYGELGDGPDTNIESTFVDVVGLSGGVQEIDAGGGTTCALMIGGRVKCWGDDSSGKVGDGDYAANKLSPVDVLVQATCVKLTLARNNAGGSVPVVSSDISTECQLGHFRRGTPIVLQAAPAANQRVQSWSAPVTAGAGAVVASFAMPNADVTITVNYAPCFALTRAHTGAGGDPVASPTSSVGCAAGRYAAGESIVLTAQPNANQRVQGWSAPVTGGVGALPGALTMPNADTTVTVAYASCFALTRTHSGAGGDPTASPASSAGCVAGRYAAGESIVLTALPNASQRVKSWSGTTGTPAVGSQVNSVTMPAADKSVSVAYEACLAVALNVTGGGALVASPAASDGCLTGGFAVGQQITVVATPAAGWRVAGWAGTQNNGSKGETNTAVIGEGGGAVGVILERVVFLPTIGK